MAKPGIKGSVFMGIVDEVRALRDGGRVSAATLEARLGKEGVGYLGDSILPAIWYPIETYGKMRELLRDIEGGGKDEYTMRSAAATARRLVESGLYQQLDYLKRWEELEPSGDPAQDARRRRELFRTQVGMVSMMYEQLYNFGIRKLVDDPSFPDRFQLEYWDGGVLPPSCRFAVVGFWNEVSLSWSAERTPDLWYLVHFPDHYFMRMSRDIADI